MEDFFGGIISLHWNWLVCKDFGICQDFVSMEKEEEEEGQEFRSLEVRCKLIALKHLANPITKNPKNVIFQLHQYPIYHFGTGKWHFFGFSCMFLNPNNLFKSFSGLLEQFFLTVGQKKFGNKIPFFVIFFSPQENQRTFHMRYTRVHNVWSLLVCMV